MRDQVETFCVATLLVGAIALSVPLPAKAAPFENLDFEEAHPVPPYYASDVLPDWANNNYLPGYIIYDTMTLGSVGVSIHDGLHRGSGDFYPLEGRYSVMLQNGAHEVGQSGTAFIAQSGDIPAWAESITFLGEAAYGAPTLLLNGTVIPTSVLYVGPVVNTNHGAEEMFTGDISAFTGRRNVELRFKSTGMNTLDDIEFSEDVVPEPSTFVLVVIGVLTACAFRLRRHRPSEV